MSADGELEQPEGEYAAPDEDRADGPIGPRGDESMLPADLPMLAEESEATVALTDSETVELQAEIVDKLRDRPHKSAMLGTMGRLLRFIGSLLFAHVLFEQRNVDNIRDASRRGNVVYVMQTRSLLDYLYFNYKFLEAGLPLPLFANGINVGWLRGPLIWLRGMFRRGPGKPEEQVQALALHGEPTFLFLEKSKNDPDENVEFSQKYLTRLIRAQRQMDRPLYVLPLLLVWAKRPDPKRSSFLGDIFGTAQKPGFFRKVWSFVQTFWESFLRLGQPVAQIGTSINLQEFLWEYPQAGSSDASELLRERLVDYLARERQVILGPTGESPEHLFAEVINRPALTKAVAEVARKEGVSEDAVRERAREQFREIAAAPGLVTLKILSSILSFVWYRIYDGFEVDEEGLERVREVARESSVVLIPSHKSHIDYLVLSYILYSYGMLPPLIAAGVNLNFWPLGWIFRKAGAFFIRRSFRGEDLYPVVFREYLIRQMEEGYPIEFFIEGTRSRTGKLIKPKYGMLDMVIRAYASGRLDRVSIVPISVGYEKVIEESSYRRELLGAEKERESLTGLLKTPKFLTSRYGRLYVEFAEPIDLGDYLAKYDIDRLRPDDAELDRLTVRLAHRIIYDINDVSTVTPSALAASVLLNNPTRGLDHDRFLREVGFLVSFLTQRVDPRRLSKTLHEALVEAELLDSLRRPRRGEAAPTLLPAPAAPEAPAPATDADAAAELERALGEAVASPVDEAMSLFAKRDQVDVEQTDGQTIYSVPEEARIELAFYRNNIVHYFVPEALLATALRRFRMETVPLEPLMEETLFLSRLFKYEWIYEERAAFTNVFLRTLADFEAAGWVEVEADEEPGGGGRVHVDANFPPELQFFRRLVLSFLEAYVVVAESLPTLLGDPVERDDIIDEALKRGRADYLRGRIMYLETISKPTFKNALRLFEDWGVIERVARGRKKDADAYRVTDEWRRGRRYDQLRHHLEEFVYGAAR